MVAISNLTLCLGALATVTSAAPTARSSTSSVSDFGGSNALAMQIFVHKVTDADAGKLCAADAGCKAALSKLEAKKQVKHSKRKIPGLSLFGGPWGLAYSLVMSTDEGQEVQGYAVSFLEGICKKDETCAEALELYQKYVEPVENKVDEVESDAENAVIGAVEDAVEKIF